MLGSGPRLPWGHTGLTTEGVQCAPPCTVQLARTSSTLDSISQRQLASVSSYDATLPALKSNCPCIWQRKVWDLITLWDIRLALTSLLY